MGDVPPHLPFRTRPCKSILMIGTHPSGKGGIASVVRAYMESKFFASYPIKYISVHRQGGSGIKVEAALQGWLQVLITLLRSGAPLLHIHLSSRASVWRKLVVCRLASAFRRPYILHVHASEFMQFYEEECSPNAKHVVQEMFAKAALILALSEQWKSDLARIWPVARIEVLSNAVRLPKLAPRPHTAARNQTILFLGRLGSRKGTGELIKAFAKISNAFPDARLVCAGDGNVEIFAHLARQLKIDTKVNFPGWLSAQECQEQLRDASIFVLPSHAEGLPMALLEAMSWKLPVIASPVGGIPQLIRYGENGLLVEAGNVQGLADACATLLSRPALCERLGAKARQTVEKSYSFEAHIQRLSDIYSLFGLQPAAPGEHQVLEPEAKDRAQTLPGPDATGLQIPQSARDRTSTPGSHPE